MYFLKDGKVKHKRMKKLGGQSAKPVSEIAKGITPEELDAFNKERSERFVVQLSGI